MSQSMPWIADEVGLFKNMISNFNLFLSLCRHGDGGDAQWRR
jgi:hypothetical protein